MALCAASLWMSGPAQALSRGDSAPELVATDLSGREVRSADLPPGPRVLSFWASWCAPCKAEIPQLNLLHSRSDELGFQLLGVAVDSGDPQAVARAAERFGIAFPVLVGTDEVTARYHILSLPTTVIIGADGLVIAQLHGPVTAQMVVDRLAQSPPPPHPPAR